MPNINPKSPGDNVYPQYNRVKSAPVSAIKIIKGRLYTKGASGDTGNQLQEVTETGFVNGIYQPAENIVTAGQAGEHTVDVFGVGSRVALIAAVAGMHSGQKISYNITTHKVEVFTGTEGGITPNEFNLCIGRIFEIKDRDIIETEKDITEADDVIIAELGMA